MTTLRRTVDQALPNERGPVDGGSGSFAQTRLMTCTVTHDLDYPTHQRAEIPGRASS